MNVRISDYYFLRGGGEMGELIRARDWSMTSLGDPNDWPPSLRTTLNIILNSKFPMFLWWGPELVCFYNDAYRPSLGQNGKHPFILGMPAEKAWTEIWHLIKPLIDQVLNGGEATWSEDQLIPIYRNGKIEDVYWTFSYSPVSDDLGKVAGVLVTCSETTEKVNTLRKIEESNLRFRNTMKQAPVGITILRGPQYIVEMANELYLQLVDKKEAEFVGYPLFDSLPEVEEAVHSLLDNVLNTGIPYQGKEVAVPVNRYGTQDIFYFDFLYQPLREDDGKISGVIVAATEVSEKVETRKKIEESKRLYETITQNTPDLIYVFDLNYRFSYANDALLNMWGLTWDDAQGKSLLEIGYEPWHAEMHEREIDQVIATKKPVRGEVSFPHASLGKRVYDYILVPVIDQSGKVEAIAGTTRDITQQVDAHKQIEESEKRFRNMVEQAPVAICVLRGENYVVDVVNEKQLRLWDKTKEQVLNKPIFEAIPEGAGQGFEQLLRGVFTTGQPFIANEFPTTLTRDGKKETFYSNFTYEPLYSGDQKIEGIISIVSDVTEQVIARKKIEENDEKLRSLIENAPFPISVYTGSEMKIEIANESIIQAWGKGNDVKGKLFREVMPELEGQHIFDQIENVFNSGVPFHAFNRELKLVMDGKEQSYYYNYSFTPLFNSAGNVFGVMNTASDVTDLNLAKKRIEENEQDLRSMALQAPIGICILDAATLVCEIVNEKFIEIAGKPRETISGKYYWETFAEVKSYYESALNQVVAEGIPFFANETELTIIRLGKEEIMYVTFVYAPLTDEKGKVKKVAVWVLDNTAQVVARRKIEEDTEKLNIVIDASELGTWELNVKTAEAKYSKRYLEILGGYKEDIKLSHSQLLKHLHPDDFPVRDKAFKEAFRTGHLHYQARLIWNDQSVHWMEGKGKVFYDDENNPVRLIGTIRDITDDKKREQELKESEYKFRLLADSMPQHIWTSDKGGNLNYYNQSVLDYSGLTWEQINREGWIQIVHPEDREENIKQWINSIATGNEFLFEHRFRRYDGEYRWQLSRAIPQRDATGKIQMWVGTSTDIQAQKTFTKELEEKVFLRTAELKASEEKFFSIFNLSPICKTLSDAASGKIVMINDAFTNIFGYGREETLNKTSAELGMLDSAARKNVLNELMENGKIQNKEIEYTKKSGEKFFALTSEEIIHIGDKQYFLGAYNDISDRKMAEKNIQQKNMELEKMNKELQSFAYISSHDLQEPLRKIQTFAARITEKEENNLTDYGRDMFNRMQDAAKRMQILIQDLLAYSRTNTAERKLETTDLNQILEDIKQDFKEELKEKQATIETDHLDVVDIIPFQFRQLMNNLISNSLKFSDPNRPLRIQISSEMAHGKDLNNENLSPQTKYCHITVSDNGIGFEQQYSQKIFEVFQRLHAKHEYSGTGIGLSIVKKIVDNHHGVITAIGELNVGATFDIYLPAS